MALYATVTTEKRPFARLDVAVCAEPEFGLRVSDTAIARMQGFGGCFNELGYRALLALDEGARAAALDDLFSPCGCNFNYCRLPVGANDFSENWYSYDETPGDYALKNFSVARDRKLLLPYVKEALRRQSGMRLFASPWSPPTWLKTNGGYAGGRLKPDAASRRAYAAYLGKYLAAYRAEGVEVAMLYPQNEVTADQCFPSCLYTGKELLEFSAKYLAPELVRQGLSTEIYLGTLNTDDFGDYAFRAFTDEAGRRTFAGIGYQWLGREAIGRTREAFPNVPLVQTESECGDGSNSFRYCEYVFSLMRRYVAAGACAYVYWNLALGKDPSSTWGWKQNSLLTVDEETGRVIKNHEYYLMKHLSAFVARGDDSLAVSGAWAPNALAFRRASGGTVVVLHNPLEKPACLRLTAPALSACVRLAGHSFTTLTV